MEMHGSIQQLVCPSEGCHTVVDMDETLMKQLLRREDIPCRSCPCLSIRCRIMLYDDKEGDAHTAHLAFLPLECLEKFLSMLQCINGRSPPAWPCHDSLHAWAPLNGHIQYGCFLYRQTGYFEAGRSKSKGFRERTHDNMSGPNLLSV